MEDEQNLLTEEDRSQRGSSEEETGFNVSFVPVNEHGTSVACQAFQEVLHRGGIYSVLQGNLTSINIHVDSFNDFGNDTCLTPKQRKSSRIDPFFLNPENPRNLVYNRVVKLRSPSNLKIPVTMHFFNPLVQKMILKDRYRAEVRRTKKFFGSKESWKENIFLGGLDTVFKAVYLETRLNFRFLETTCRTLNLPKEVSSLGFGISRYRNISREQVESTERDILVFTIDQYDKRKDEWEAKYRLVGTDIPERLITLSEYKGIERGIKEVVKRRQQSTSQY